MSHLPTACGRGFSADDNVTHRIEVGARLCVCVTKSVPSQATNAMSHLFCPLTDPGVRFRSCFAFGVVIAASVALVVHAIPAVPRAASCAWPRAMFLLLLWSLLPSRDKINGTLLLNDARNKINKTETLKPLPSSMLVSACIDCENARRRRPIYFVPFTHCVRPWVQRERQGHPSH